MNTKELELQFVTLLLNDHAKRKAEQQVKDTPPAPPKLMKDPISNLIKQDEYEQELLKWTNSHDAGCPTGCSGDHSAERAIFEKSTADKLRAVQLLKAEGNELFRTSEFAQACLCYRRGLVFLDYTFPDTAEEQMEMDELEVSLCLNLATSKEKQQEYTESLLFAQRALKKAPSNAKVHFRMALAYLGVDDYTACETALSQAATLAPGDEAVRKTFAILRERRAEYARREKVIAQKIVN